MSEIKPKKEKRFLKTLGRVGEILVEQVLLKLGSSIIRKIGGKKTLPSILFIFLSFTLFAQYPNTLNKQRLGFQTTGDGLTWRGSLSDTASIQPTNNQNAWVILDTINLKFYSFDFTSNVWNLVGGGSAAFTQPVDSLFFNVNVPTNNVDTAKMRWDSDLATVVLGLNDNVPNELGFKNFWLVKNQTGATITKGSIVYANGTVGASGRITVAKFIANGSIDAKYLLGITAHDLSNGEDGYVISFGKIRQVNTDTFAAGAILYPSPTVAGVWTDIEPVAPNIDMPIGFCINSHVNNGTIAIRVASGYKLSELHDVAISSPVDKASLYYSGGLWRDTTAALLVSDTASMLDKYLRLSGGTLTGALNGTSLNFSSGAVFNENANNSDFRVESVGRPNMFFVDAFNNRVGIGTNSPQAMLEVDGTLEIRDSATFYRGAKFLKSNPNTRFLIEGTNKTMFYGNLNEDKIGIGTTLPTKTLDVNGTLNATDSVTFGNTLSVTGNITENGLNVLTSSDTASMLTPYFRDADTSLLNLTSRFATKLNISDTASMLTNYLRTGVAASTYQTKLTNPITGTGTINYIPKFTASNTLGNANLFTNGNRLVQNEGEDLSFGSDYMGNTSNPFIGNNVKAGSVGETIQRIASTTLFNPSAIIFGFQRVNNSSGATSLGGINFMTTSGNPSGDINPIDSSRMFIEPRGNIGIGTMQPSYKFDIRGTLNATGATTLGSTLAVTGNITEGGNNVLTSGDTTSMLTPYWRSGRFSGVLPVANGGTNRTTMPAGYLLHGDGTSVDTSIGLFYDNTNKRLGIGTNNPQSPLQVDGTLTKTTTNFWHYLMFDNTAPAVGVGAGFMFGGLKTSTAQEAFAAIDGYKETSSVTPGLNAAGAMRFHTQVTTGTGVVEGMRLNSTQELGIGYGATDNGAYKLQVNSQIFATNSLIATSDLRFKENIQPLDKGLEIINKLKPVKFNFISTTENNFSEYDEIGFIAQDVEGALTTELFAKAVVKKFDEGKEDSPLGLMTEKLIPILVKAIQEQQALIKALEQRILTLENK